MTDLRSILLGLGRTLMSDLGPAAPRWAPTDVTWDWIGSALPAQVAGLVIEPHDPFDSWLLALKEARAAAMVTFSGGTPAETCVVAVPVWESTGRLVGEYASQLQDHAVESRAAWAQPLPPCPLHASRHPLDVRYDDDGAWWWCAHDGARVRDLPAVDELGFWAG